MFKTIKLTKSLAVITAAVLASSVLPSYALQIKNAVDDEPISASIAMYELTRIFVDGDRISNVVGINGSYLLQNDEQQGAIFIKPSAAYVVAAKKAKEIEEKQEEEKNIAAKILENQNKVARNTADEFKVPEQLPKQMPALIGPTSSQQNEMQKNEAINKAIAVSAKAKINEETKKTAPENSEKAHTQQVEKITKPEKIKTRHDLKPLNLFISTQTGHNYILLLTPRNTQSETIMLKPKQPPYTSKRLPLSVDARVSYQQSIVRLMNVMVNGAVSDEYTISNFNVNKKPQYKLDQADLFLVSVYSNEELRGEVYKVVNNSELPITISEQQFYRDGVRAVTIKDRVIQPFNETFIYLVI